MGTRQDVVQPGLLQSSQETYQQPSRPLESESIFCLAFLLHTMHELQLWGSHSHQEFAALQQPVDQGIKAAMQLCDVPHMMFFLDTSSGRQHSF